MRYYHIEANDRRVVFKTGGRFVCALGISDKFWDAVDVLSRSNRHPFIHGMRVESVACIESYECANQFFDVKNTGLSPEFERVDKWVVKVKADSPESALITVFGEDSRDYVELSINRKNDQG